MSADNEGDTPLHKALRCGHDEVGVSLLLRRDSQLLVSVNGAGESAAYLAAACSCTRSLEAILDADEASFSGPFGLTAFHPATKLTGDIMSKLLLKGRQVLKDQDNDGKCVLHYSVEEKRNAMVEMLLKADNTLAYLRDKDGFTPLHIAASRGFLTIVHTILELSPQSLPIRDTFHGKNALHVANMDACSLEECLKNTRMKELINDVDNDGNSPLHIALINSDIATADKLLQVVGINCRLANKQGRSPMDLCTSNHHIYRKMKSLIEDSRITKTVNMEIFFNKDVVHVDDLLDHYTWDECLAYKGPEGDTILHIAARDGNMKTVSKANESTSALYLLLSGQNSNGETPLHLAAHQGQLEVVTYILSQCSTPTTMLGNGDNPSTTVAIGNQVANVMPWRIKSFNGDTPAHKAVRSRHTSTALLLLQHDPMLISLTNNSDESLLYLAAEYQCFDVLENILSLHGERDDFITSGGGGQNVLHAAARNRGVSLCESLIVRQPNLLKMVDAKGKTPLHYATEHNRKSNVLRLLKHDKSAAFVYDNEGFTPLLRAAALGYKGSVKKILTLCPHSAELRDLSNNGTVLHLAKMSNTILKWSMRHQVMVKLVNKTDNDGNTALHRAICDGDVDKALVLLKTKGINRMIQNKMNLSPSNLCQQLNKSGETYQRPVHIALHSLAYHERASSRPGKLIRHAAFKLITDYANKIMTDKNAKKLVDNIAVAAGLLLTITSAAAFTVPGGYDQSSGDAVRMKQGAIKTFMASDVLAMLMCVSILVRYTVGVGGRPHKLRRLALDSIFMLQISLLAAVVALVSAAYAIALPFKSVVVVPIVVVVLLNLLLLVRPDLVEFYF